MSALKYTQQLLQQFAHLQLVDYKQRHEKWVDPSHTILTSAQWPSGEILKIASEEGFTSFLNTQNKNFDSELFTALHVYDNPQQFLQNPLSALFAKTKQVLEIKYRTPNDKQMLLEKMVPFLEATQSRLAQEHGRLIFEELFMNSVYDAPAEAKKLGLADQNKECHFTLAFDHEKLVISCFDEYGSLEPKKLIKRMHDIESYGTKGIINLGDRPGGAGIGCSLIYQYSTSLIITVEPGMGTRFTCTIPMKISNRTFYKTGKNLQVFKIEKSGGSNG